MLPVYAELYCRSAFSFQVGASQPEALVRTAQTLSYRALAVTDECSLAGSVRAHLEWIELNKAGHGTLANTLTMQLITGSCFALAGHTLIVLAQTRHGYGRLSALITTARQRKGKGEYQLELADLLNVEACFAIVIPALIVEPLPKPEAKPTPSATSRAPLNHAAISADELLAALAHLPRALGYSRLLTATDALRFEQIVALSLKHQLPITACGDVLIHDKAQQPLHDILTAVRCGTTVDELGSRVQQNAERCLRPLQALETLYPMALMLTSVDIAATCTFTLDELKYEYPQEIVPPGFTLAGYLRRETYCGARRRYGETIPDAAVALIEKELSLIAELHYEAYFLTVYDIVAFARSQSILCQGRGSAANSAVCYCLHITEVDPARMSMLFERFISKERNEPPDIDVDFEHQRREEVIQYIYRKYGRDRAALCAAVACYRPKGAMRDVGKALGFSLDQVDRISKNLAWWDHAEDIERRMTELGFDVRNKRVQQLIFYARALIGFPRHLSQHPGGFVIARGRLDHLVPIENAAMPDRTVIQWDKDDIDALGLMKVDILGLGMLSCIRRALDLVSAQLHRPFALQDIPAEDPAVYDMLCRGESTGVFQVESRAQMNMLPRLKPRNYFDLVIEVAIVRPGPIQGGMVHPYLKRRQGIEKVSYPSTAVESVLKRTLGIPIFQEQVMQLAMVAAGFSAGEADQLRRAMAAWKRKGGLGHLKDKLTNGMLANGYTPEFAESIYMQIAGFGTYGFPESHAASFALLVYASSWLKHHHPAVFCCALLNSQPMGFYSPSQLTQDAQHNGVTVLPVDVMQSTWESHLVPSPNAAQPMLRLGLRLVAGLSGEAGARIMVARAQRHFISMRDLITRAQLDRGDADALARADALSSLAGNRIQSLWAAGAAALPDLPLAPSDELHDAVPLNPLSLGQEVLADYQSTGLSLRAHPVSLVRHALKGTYRANELKNVPSGRSIRVAGLVTCRQRPGTASGVTFVTLEDETGNTNVVVWKDLAESERVDLLSSRLMIVHGMLEHQGPITHLIARHLENATALLAGLNVSSRDFH
jgi:error-prone DNA polymerase